MPESKRKVDSSVCRLYVKNYETKYGHFTCPFCKHEKNLWKWGNCGGRCDRCGKYFQKNDGEHIRLDERRYCDMFFEVDYWQDREKGNIYGQTAEEA